MAARYLVQTRKAAKAGSCREMVSEEHHSGYRFEVEVVEVHAKTDLYFENATGFGRHPRTGLEVRYVDVVEMARKSREI